MKRRKLHRIIFTLAGIYNICWGSYASYDPQYVFRFAKMAETNYPEIFACLGMVVGLYGVIYLEVARKPEKGFVLALVGFIGKLLGPIGAIYYIYIGKWLPSAIILNVTNDFTWLIPFAIYLKDSWSYFKKDLLEED